jgi:hypothetical protein
VIHGSHGVYNFSPEQTALPSTQGQNLGGRSVGHPCELLLGRANTASVSNPTDPNWYRPAVSVFLQDTWRVGRPSRSTTACAGTGRRCSAKRDLRSMFSPGTRIRRPGIARATIYEGEGDGACNCRFVETYPYSFGPRVGVTYQITPKTVLRAGWGLTYAQTGNGQSDGGSILGAGGWNTFNFESPAFGEPGAVLRNGLVYDREALFASTTIPASGRPAARWTRLRSGSIPMPGRCRA